MIIYRLGSPLYPANDGLGSSLYGGRWNHKGTPVIYAAASRALCALEVLANSDGLAASYVVIPFEILDTDIKRITPADLPQGWNASPPPNFTREIGTEWAQSMSSLILEVPSSIVPQESNYLLNPLHPNFLHVRVLDAEPFHFDARLRQV